MVVSTGLVDSVRLRHKKLKKFAQRLLPKPMVPLIAEGIRAIRYSSWRPTVDSFQPGPIVVSGYVKEVGGLGTACRMTVAALARAGVDPILHDIRPTLDHYPRGGLRLPGDNSGVWLIQANAPACDKVLQSTDPKSWLGRYRIAYWAWETTEAPPSWVRTADWFEEIWSISQFSANAIESSFKKAGRHDLIKKIRVMPCPMSRSNGMSRRQHFEFPEGALIALSIFDGRSTFARKNPLGAIEAWKIAFPEPTAKALLVVKSIDAHVDPAAMRCLTDAVRGRPDIRLFDKRLSDADMADLIASIDAVVLLHRSEGFGLLAAEALSLGKLVVASNYSAPAEWLDSTNALLVDVHEVPVDDPSGTYIVGCWGEPDMGSAANAIRRLLADKDALEDMCKNALTKAAIFDLPWTQHQIDAFCWRRLVSTARRLEN